MLKSFITNVVIAGALAATTHAQPRNSTGFIKAGNFSVYYQTIGGGPALLLLHAGLQNSGMWAPQVKALSKNYRVVTIDLPYHGRTTGKDTALLAQEVVRMVLDSLRITRTAVAGLSMGASVAEDFIIAYPERTTKAILISAGINGYDKKFPIDSASMAWYYKFSAALDAKDEATAAAEFTKAWAEGIYRGADGLKKPYSVYVYNTTLATLKQHHMAGWPALQQQPPALESLAKIKVPVLVIDGDKDLPYIRTTSRYLRAHIPGANGLTIPNVAHMLNLEKPAEVNRMIARFLAEQTPQ